MSISRPKEMSYSYVLMHLQNHSNSYFQVKLYLLQNQHHLLWAFLFKVFIPR